MAFMNWSEHFVTGIELVDRQHHGLVDLVNTVAPRVFAGQATAAGDAEALVDRLAAYAATHFRDEEQLMREAGIDFAYLAAHAGSHLNFVEEVGFFRGQLAQGAQLDGRLLLRFLSSWLTFHILVEDQDMARQLRLIAVGHTPAEAATLAGAQTDSSAHAVLIDALIDLFAVVSKRSRTLLQVNQELEATQSRLAELNSRLEQLVRERTSELSHANSTLLQEQKELRQAMETIERTQSRLLQSEKMAAVGQLAAGVAHEINNPIGFVTSNLGSLKIYVGRLLELIDVSVPAAAALAAEHPARLAVERTRQTIEIDFLRADIPDLLRESADGLARVRKIVADLRDFSHVDETEWQDANLVHGLEGTLNMVWNELRYKAQVVRKFGELPLVRCIPAQLNQVFLNLLVNAGQAIETTGTITLRSGHAGRHVWIEVEDTGIGIPPAVQQRMFEPFFTTKPVGQGTGLGLSISWDIIERHGGTIRVDSTAGRGTCFRISLPIAGRETGGDPVR